MEIVRDKDGVVFMLNEERRKMVKEFKEVISKRVYAMLEVKPDSFRLICWYKSRPNRTKD